MWSSPHTTTISAFVSHSSKALPASQTPDSVTYSTPDFINGTSLSQTFAKSGSLNNLAGAIGDEFWLGDFTTDNITARSRDRATPSENITLDSQAPLARSVPEYGLDPIESSFVVQSLRPKQGSHVFSSRFQSLLERKLQAELAAKEQQSIAAESQQSRTTCFDSGGPLELGSLQSTGQEPLVSGSNSQFAPSHSLDYIKQGQDTGTYAIHGNMPGLPRDGNEQFFRQNRHIGAASHYKDMSSSDAFATPSIVPPNILPPAVQTSYQPAPFRSQHYQRLLAAKLANSGQIGQESNANDAAAAASFMQNWGDHLLDPNFPTPQEMSFLPSSQSPLYQLFTSGHTQDQWQDGGSFQEPTAVRPTAESMAPNSFTSGHYAASGNSSRQIPSANHFQRPEAGSSASSNTSYLQVSESGNKYVPWINPYAQAAEVNDATSVESSRAPGHHYPNGREMQRGEDAMFREPVHTAAAAPASEPAPSSHQSGNQEMHDMSANPYGEENAPSPDNNANTTFTDDGGEEGEEPKKAVLACHFCRGRKLKCDGTRPTCAHCEKRSLACSYDAKIRRRGPGKRKREQLAMLAAAEGQMDEDGTPLLHKLLAPKPKGKRGRKPKNRIGEGAGVGGGEAGSTSTDMNLQTHSSGSNHMTGDVPYTRPPNPYLPSYFIPADQSSSHFPLMNNGHARLPPSPLHQQQQHEQQEPQHQHPQQQLHPRHHQHSQLHQHPGPGQHPHLDPKLSHVSVPSSSRPHAYQDAYHSPSAWPEDLEPSGKRQRNDQYSVHGSW